MYTGLTAKLTVVVEKEVEKNDGSNKTVEVVKEDKVIGYISNWSVEESRDTIEVTRLGKKEKEILPSLYSWTASAEGAADFTDKESQKYLREAMIDGAEVDVKFYLDCDENETKYTYLTGKAYVTSFSTDISAEDKGNVSISLTGTGDLKLSISPAQAN